MSNVVRNMVNIIGIADRIPEYSEIYKEFALNDMVLISDTKPDICKVLSAAFDAKVTSIRIIDTPYGKKVNGFPETITSYEGETLTGKKLVVDINFKQKIQYVDCSCSQKIHGVHNEFTVTEFIVIPQTFVIGGECVTAEYLESNNMFYLSPFILDANITNLNERLFSTNITAFLQVNVKNCLYDRGTVTTPVGNVTKFSDTCELYKTALTTLIKGGTVNDLQ